MFELCEGKEYITRLPLLSSPNWVFGLTAAYLLIILKLGPAWMKDRAPFNLKKILLVYNVMQIVVNFYIFLHSTYFIFNFRPYDYGCMLSIPLDHPLKAVELRLGYLFFISRIIDFTETIFFVLRKSYKQITFLHVFHHVYVVIFGFYYIHCFGTGGHNVLTAVMNAFVHGVMYTYYFLSALRPGMKQSLWWKKHITHIQLIQFVIIFLHTTYPLLFRPDCEYPKVYLYFNLFISVTLIILFGNFYRKTYLMAGKEKKAKAKK